jgi:hypothetical protein
VAELGSNVHLSTLQVKVQSLLFLFHLCKFIFSSQPYNNPNSTLSNEHKNSPMNSIKGGGRISKKENNKENRAAVLLRLPPSQSQTTFIFQSLITQSLPYQPLSSKGEGRSDHCHCHLHRRPEPLSFLLFCFTCLFIYLLIYLF